jgi:hypothetical protein
MTEEDSVNEDVLPGLLEILEFRDATYSSLTDAAILPYQQKLTTAVSTFLNYDASIVWSDIHTMRQLAGFVTISGHLLPKIGDNVRDENSDMIKITRENLNKFRSMIRFVVPIKLLEIGSVDQVFSFIRELSLMAARLSELELQAILERYDCEDIDAVLSHTDCAVMPPQIATPSDKINETSAATAFGDNILSDDQATRLKLYSNIVSETRH